MPQFLCLHCIFLFDCFYDFFLIKKKAIFTQVRYTDRVLEAPLCNPPQETFFFFFFGYSKNEKKKVLNISMNNTCAQCSRMLVQSVLDTVINKSLKAFPCIWNKGYRKPQAGSSLVNITSCLPTCTRSRVSAAAVGAPVGTSISAREPQVCTEDEQAPVPMGVFHPPPADAAVCKHLAPEGGEVWSLRRIMESSSISKGGEGLSGKPERALPSSCAWIKCSRGGHSSSCPACDSQAQIMASSCDLLHSASSNTNKS